MRCRRMACLFRGLGVLLSAVAGSASVRAGDGVILLHGLARTNASMQRMEAALQQAGYVVANVDYPSRTLTIERLSDEAITRGLAAPGVSACDRVHFVTHSMGGILVRSYLLRHPLPNLGRVVMLGPPNQGSEVVDRLGDWWLFRQINGSPGGELGTGPESTPNRLGPVGFELGVIAGDRSINWINSALIPGPDDGKVSVEHCKVAGMNAFIVLHVTHPLMMNDPAVIENTMAFLRDGRFLPPTAPARQPAAAGG